MPAALCWASGQTTLLQLCNATTQTDNLLHASRGAKSILATNILQCTKLFAHEAVEWNGVTTVTDKEQQMNNMQSPKILPWIAKRAGISEELALKLWRRAVGEAETLTGQSSGAEFSGLAIERFLAIVEDEADTQSAAKLSPAPQLSWLWRHQTRMSLLSLMAAQNTYQFWQNTWNDMVGQKKAA